MGKVTFKRNSYGKGGGKKKEITISDCLKISISSNGINTLVNSGENHWHILLSYP